MEMVSTLSLVLCAGIGAKVFAPVATALALAVGVLTSRSSIGDNNAVAHATDNASLTAGGTGDDTEVVGQIIDRAAYGYAQSVLIAIPCKAVLTANKALNIAWHLEHGNASNLSDATDYVNVGAAAVLSSVAGGTVRGVFGNDVDLGGASRYIRLKFTPDLTASSTDTAECASCFTFSRV
jgi:hypothetical protein